MIGITASPTPFLRRRQRPPSNNQTHPRITCPFNPTEPSTEQFGSFCLQWQWFYEGKGVVESDRRKKIASQTLKGTHIFWLVCPGETFYLSSFRGSNATGQRQSVVRRKGQKPDTMIQCTKHESSVILPKKTLGIGRSNGTFTICV